MEGHKSQNGGTFGGGEYPEEAYWIVYDAAGQEVSGCSGNAGVPATFTCCLVPGASYTMYCADAYGDGWGGAKVQLGSSVTLCEDQAGEASGETQPGKRRRGAQAEASG